MAVPKTTLEKQQKTANLLAAGNLWYQRKSSVALEKMSQVSAQTLEQTRITNAKLTSINNNMKALGAIAEEQIRETKMQSARQEQRYAEEDSRRLTKENAEKENAFRRDAFFHLSEELSELESSSISNLEKYFSIMSVNSLMTNYKISTSLTDDLNEKKVISDALNKIKNLEQNILKDFSDQDNLDLNSIFEIMEEDEESEINNLNNKKSKIQGIAKEIENLKNSKNLAEIVKKYPKIVEEIK